MVVVVAMSGLWPMPRSTRWWIFAFRAVTRPSAVEHGMGSDMFGAMGDDITLKMPVGTIITDAETGDVLYELLVPGEKIMIAKGGDGGFGNMRFKSAINRAPRQKTPGYDGERKELKLELKVLADVGLLGMPNAGKSTLISAISNARPKIADYPFTTLHPNLGVVRVGPEQSFVVADVPGLIEGASEGAGLGHQFLRHLQRTRILLHMVDFAPFDDAVDPVKQAKAIVGELKKYDDALYHKAALVGAEQAGHGARGGARGQGQRLRQALPHRLKNQSRRLLAGVSNLRAHPRGLRALGASHHGACAQHPARRRGARVH